MDDSESEGDDGSYAEQVEDDDMELSDVGGGCGHGKTLSDDTIKPITYQLLSPIVMELLHHACWGMSVLDMIPGIGDVARNKAPSCIGDLSMLSLFLRHYLFKLLAQSSNHLVSTVPANLT